MSKLLSACVMLHMPLPSCRHSSQQAASSQQKCIAAMPGRDMHDRHGQPTCSFSGCTAGGSLATSCHQCALVSVRMEYIVKTRRESVGEFACLLRSAGTLHDKFYFSRAGNF